jgi:hypothetical protein
MAHSAPLPWFRLYTRMIDDEKMRLLAFEDRWHFVALCCMKGSGLIDDDSAIRDRKIAVKLGVQLADLENIKKRLIEVGLIDESMSPLAWDDLQFTSDTSKDRVKKYREKQKLTNMKRECNVTVTVQDKDTDTDKENILQKKDDSIFKVFWDQYPNKTAKAYAEKLFSKLSPADQKLAIDSLPKFNAELTERRKTFKTLSAPNPSTYLNQRRFDDYKPAPVDWKEIMFAARKLNAWSPKKWGPAPFTTGCTVPKELLTQSDNRPWQEWKPPS